MGVDLGGEESVTQQHAQSAGCLPAFVLGAHAEGIDVSRRHRLRIGLEGHWHPASWLAELPRHRRLREQLGRAQAKGVQVAEVEGARRDALYASSSFQRLNHAWQHRQGMAPMAFALSWQRTHQTLPCRIWVARHRAALSGYVMVVALSPRRWVVQHWVRHPSAPNGLVELMIAQVLRAAAAQDVQDLSLGMSPLAGEVNPILKVIRRASQSLYSFEGLHTFKRRLQPQRWDEVYLAYPKSSSAIAALYWVLRAFAGKGLLAFAWQSLRHRLSQGPRRASFYAPREIESKA